MVGSLVLAALVYKPQTLDAQGIYRRLLPSVMTLTAKEKDGDSIGTGFLALHSGIAVTAWHVVKRASKVTARFSDGTECEVAGLVAKDEVRDIAIIKVKAPDRPILTLAKGDPEIGSKCFIIGAPQGLEFSISDGIISQLRSVKGVKELQHTCPQNPGNSGGPLVDGQGHVLGIIDWHLRDSENLNFAIASSYTRGMDLTHLESWSSVAAASSNDEIDSVIVDALASLQDASTAVQYLNNEMVRKEGGFHQAFPAFYFVVRNGIADELEKLGSLSTQDRYRQSAKTELSGRLQDMIVAMDWVVKAIKVAQSTDGWSDEAKSTVGRSADPFHRALASLPAVHEYFSKEGDKSRLSSMIRVTSGLETDPSGYSIGLYSFEADELHLIEVLPKSFGESLGFKTGDHVISVNGAKLETLIGLKLAIKAARGTTISVTMVRDGEEVDMSVAVPDQIPSQFVYSN